MRIMGIVCFPLDRSETVTHIISGFNSGHLSATCTTSRQVTIFFFLCVLRPPRDYLAVCMFVRAEISTLG